MIREDWINIKLGDAFFTTSGGTPSRKIATYFNGDIPWVKSGELNYNIIKDTEEHITEEAIKNSSAKIFPEETLLIALYGATIGKLAILGVPAATNQAVCGIYKNNNFLTKFIYYYLFYKKPNLIGQGIGGAQPNISQTILKKLLVPVVSQPEQRAIVAKIEELFSELDSGIDSLNKAKKQLEVYRQAVLKAAFEGKLTKEWRGKNPARLSKWIKIRLDDVSNAIGGYAFKSKDYKETGRYQIIRIGNIREGQIRYNASPIYIDDVDEVILTKYKLNPKDVLITLTGTRNKRDYGYTTLVDNNNLLLNQRVASLRFNSRCIPEYFLYYSWTNEFKNQFFASETGNVGQGNVGMKSIRNTKIPLPCIEEQHQIVQEIESRLSVCENIEANIEEALEKAEGLRQSILKKAFEGKLLSKEELEACKQEEDWEPAEDLLKRIKEANKEVN